MMDFEVKIETVKLLQKKQELTQSQLHTEDLRQQLLREQIRIAQQK